MLSLRDLGGSGSPLLLLQGRSRQSGSEKDRESSVGKEFRDVDILVWRRDGSPSPFPVTRCPADGKA